VRFLNITLSSTLTPLTHNISFSPYIFHIYSIFFQTKCLAPNVWEWKKCFNVKKNSVFIQSKKKLKRHLPLTSPGAILFEKNSLNFTYDRISWCIFRHHNGLKNWILLLCLNKMSHFQYQWIAIKKWKIYSEKKSFLNVFFPRTFSKPLIKL